MHHSNGCELWMPAGTTAGVGAFPVKGAKFMMDIVIAISRKL